MGNCQVVKPIQPNLSNFKHRKEIKTQEELIIALQQAFNRGFDEGPHWAQVYSA